MKAAVALLEREIKSLQQLKDRDSPNIYGDPKFFKIIRIANKRLSNEISELKEALDCLKKELKE